MQNQSITGHGRVLNDLRKLLMSLSFTQTALVIRRSSPYTPKHSTDNQQYHLHAADSITLLGKYKAIKYCQSLECIVAKHQHK